MESVYDVTVLGAGVEGSSTAYYLANKAEVKMVLLLEQVSTSDHFRSMQCSYTILPPTHTHT